MSDPFSARPPPTSSHSYTAGPSSSSDAMRPTLKRRYTDTKDDPFLPPPPQSQPAPSSSQASKQIRPPPPPRTNTQTAVRHGTLSAAYSMDPTPDDPDAIFIHPPFTDFPNAHLHNDGLTYNLMAANPNWFLDPKDYITGQEGDSPAAITYPTQLEPPRGWCPTKKREMKDKEGWRQGEEPRLRCTFCRRFYAGVNAKSMWRRHVFEKHKIAMANRRDNNNAGRSGRGSNKENKETKEDNHRARRPANTTNPSGNRPSTSRSRARGNEQRTHGHDQNEDVPTHDENSVMNRPSTSGTRVSEPHEDEHEDEGEGDVPTNGEASQQHDNSLSAAADAALTDGEGDVIQVATSSSTPPLTPGLSPEKERLYGQAFLSDSPYDPLVTPSFKHSPTRLPYDQPWRFPSPNHPLNTREMSLAMLVRPDASPAITLSTRDHLQPQPRVFDASPLLPGIDNGLHDEEARNRKFLNNPGRIFGDPFPTPFTDRVKFHQHRVPESPLGRNFNKPKDLMSLVLSGEDWRKAKRSPFATSKFSTPIKFSPTKFSPVKFSPARTPSRGTGLLGPIELEDPFSILRWNSPRAGSSFDLRDASPPDSSPEAESPVLRTSQLPPTDSANTSLSSQESSGWGAGLAARFSLTLKDRVEMLPSDDDDDEDEYHPPSSPKREDLFRSRFSSPTAFIERSKGKARSSPFEDEDADMEIHQRKRRRTVSGRD